MKSRKLTLPDWDITSLDRLGVPVNRVETDSRRLLQGDIFLAYPGMNFDSRQLIAEALQRGAAAVLWDPADRFEWHPTWECPNLAVPQLRDYAGIIASYVYKYPSQQMKVIGTTGTNGKTSISHWLAQAFTLLEKKTALIGTIGNGVYGTVLSEATHTTPEAVPLQQKLVEYLQQGVTTVTMEVSSHALDQGRVNGVAFSTAIFTNLTRDHLDYHRTMEAYGATKALLFDWENLQHCIINTDDKFGASLADTLDKNSSTLIRYGLTGGDIYPLSVEASLQGLVMSVSTPWGTTEIHSSLLGHFNALNLLACLGALCVNGVPLSHAAQLLGKIQPACGRMQCLGGKQEPLVIVDYAHTPDALEKALTTLKALRTAGSRLICVFGCGGERDLGKRPLMGKVAERLADVVVVTSDNPRAEDPDAIIAQIITGLNQPVYCEVDRERAICWAVNQANAEDMVLIAGKGHEEYQEVLGKKRPFSDISVAERALTQWRERQHVNA